MKYIAFILAMIIQITTCIPCSDTAECNTIVHTQDDSNDHETHNHEAETCSPFCACSCCATMVGYLILSNPTIDFTSKMIPYTEYLENGEQFISYEDQTIWQPPQLV